MLLKARLITLPNKFSMPPHCCVLTGRRDGEIVDFGVDYEGSDPRIQIRRSQVEHVAEHLLGMVPEKKVTAMAERIEELEAVGKQLLDDADERVKASILEALGYEAIPDPGDGPPDDPDTADEDAPEAPVPDPVDEATQPQEEAA